MSTKLNPKQLRYIGFDLIRIFAMVAIAAFHFIEAAYWQDAMFFPKEQSIFFNAIHIISKQMSFSGFVIVALTTFLMGFNDSLRRLTKKNYLVFAILCFGGFVLFPLYWGSGSWAFEWDIYHFLLVALGFLILIRKMSLKLVYLFGILGFVILWFPLWNFEFRLQGYPFLHEVLLGICTDSKKGTWPLLPWLGLPCLAFAFGFFAKKYRDHLGGITKYDLMLIPFLILSLPYLVVSYNQPALGEGFYCFMNRQGPIPFWSNLIWVFVSIRLAMHTKINEFLYKIPGIKDVAKLEISRNFGLFYLTQVIVIQSYSGLSIFQTNATVTGIVMFTIVPVTEILLRLIKIVWQFLRLRFFSRSLK